MAFLFLIIPNFSNSIPNISNWKNNLDVSALYMVYDIKS